VAILLTNIRVALKCELSFYIYIENARDSLPSIFLALFQSYIEHDLRKNKIVVAPPPVFLGISTKIETLALNL
jgi:hypothetical protein